MKALALYGQTPGRRTLIMDLLYFLWMLPAVWAVEGEPMFNSSSIECLSVCGHHECRTTADRNVKARCKLVTAGEE